jgi:hypothetical protein
MDSITPLSHSVEIHADGCKCLKQGRLSVVARDGIEPPTPAFSGLYSSVGKPFIPRALTTLLHLQTAELLEPIGTSISSPGV